MVPRASWREVALEMMGTLAVFLVSEGASYISGETVVADGGAWLGTASVWMGT